MQSTRSIRAAAAAALDLGAEAAAIGQAGQRRRSSASAASTLLGRLARGDVAHDAHHAVDLAILVADGAGVGFEPAPGPSAVSARYSKLRVSPGAAMRRVMLRRGRGRDARARSGGRLFWPIRSVSIMAAELADRRRDEADAAVGLEVEQDVGRMVGEQAIARLAHPQLAVKAAAVLQVGGDREQGQHGGGKIELEELQRWR